MNKESAVEEIKRSKPRIVYVSGKTCTGKTTFANEIASTGYQAIELDVIVNRSITLPFSLKDTNNAFIAAYKGVGPAKQTEAFVTSARNEITEKAALSPVVIEGAIAKSRILRAIFAEELGSFFFVYFHPMNTETYAERIRIRFVAGGLSNSSGLPSGFWDLIRKEDLEFFMRTKAINVGIEASIKEYARISMKESAERLRHFKESFEVCVVEV